jgi:hypothetical protein
VAIAAVMASLEVRLSAPFFSYTNTSIFFIIVLLNFSDEY